jgi:hypothetical protein
MAGMMGGMGGLAGQMGGMAMNDDDDFDEEEDAAALEEMMKDMPPEFLEHMMRSMDSTGQVNHALVTSLGVGAPLIV